MALLGSIEEFRSATVSWPEYIERLEFYFAANEIENVEKKRAVLLSVCGAETFSLIRSLVSPAPLTTVPYQAIVEKVRDYFSPAESQIMCRFRFNKRDQKNGEDLPVYLTELRKLAEKCGYGENLHDMLRDRFVCGLKCEQIQRQLLAKVELTFDSAVALALAAETAQKQADEIKASATPALSDNPVNIIRQPELKNFKSCYRCNEKHAPNACRFINTKCNYCKKIGHIERCCITKSKANKRSSTGQANNVGFSENHSEDDRENRLDNIAVINTDDSASPIQLSVKLDGKTLKMELDSGAACSVIDRAEFVKLWPSDPPRLFKESRKLRTWTQETLRILGVCFVNVTYGGKHAKLKLHVVRGGGPSLLGRSWFRPLGIRIEGVNANIFNNSFTEGTQKLLDCFPDVFNEDLDAYMGPLVTIEVDPAVHPKFRKCRAVPFPLRPRLEQELNRLIEQGILEPVRHSSWATPIVTVLKKNGELRICGDYKSTVNIASKLDSYPLPTVNEVLTSLSGGTVFSKLDMAQAYQQLKVDEATADLQTLNTPKGLMRVKRLQFGINSAVGIFQRIIETCLAGIEGVKPYLDDIFVSGVDAEQHDRNLKKVLERLSAFGFRLKKSKCSFAVPRLEVLGYRVDKDGVRPTESKVQAIKSAPEPKNKTELQAFLGLLNFYNCFLQQRATVLEPLHRLLDKKTPWKWKKNHADAFSKAKALLSSEDLLVHYDPERPLVVACDASPYGVGAVLSHVLEDGREAPVAYASRTLTPTERNYAHIDKEALAMIYGVRKFNQYLAGRRFQIVTDHKPLLGLMKPKAQTPEVISPRMLRWNLILGAYDYELLHRPGKDMSNADGLSRLPITTSDTTTPPGGIFLLEKDSQLPISADQVAAASKKDKTISRVQHWTCTCWPEGTVGDEFTSFKRRRYELSTERNCLLWGNRVVIPESLRGDIMEMLHDAHPGMVRMKALARAYVWWPGMDQMIEEKVRSCRICQENGNAPPKAPDQLWPQNGKRWSRLHIDFAGPFQGCTFLIVVDSFTKWLEVIRVASPSSAAVIRACRNLFATHGVPDLIVSDNGTAFTSAEFDAFLQRNGIQHVFTTPYHPSSNGQAERMVGVTKSSLKKITVGDWSTRLPRFLLQHRVTPNCATGLSPAEMLMGRRLQTTLDLLHPSSYHQSRRENNLVKEKGEASANTRAFEKDDSVYMRNFQATGPSWVPALIEAAEGPVTYTVRTPDGAQTRRHIDQLKARQDAEERNDAPSPSEITHSRPPTPAPAATTSQMSPSPSTSLESSPPRGPRRSQRKRSVPVHLRDFVSVGKGEGCYVPQSPTGPTARPPYT